MYSCSNCQQDVLMLLWYWWFSLVPHFNDYDSWFWTWSSSVISINCHNYYHIIIKCQYYYHIIMTLFLYLPNEKEDQVFPGTLLYWLWNSWSVFTSDWSGRWNTSRCICRKSAWTIFTVHLISLCCQLIYIEKCRKWCTN